MSLKGGVGKTTLALETASCLANDFRKKVLLVDANFSAPNLGIYFGLNTDKHLQDALSGETGMHIVIYEAFGFDVAPSALYFEKSINFENLKKILEKYKERYDYIILDSSPHYSEMRPVISLADKIFIITTPDKVSMHMSMKVAKDAKNSKLPVEGVLINKIRDKKYELDLLEIEKTTSFPVLARIKDHKKVLEAGFNKTPLNVYDGLNEVSREIKRFSMALVGQKENKTFFERIFKINFGKEKVNRELMRQKFYERQIN